MVIGGNFFSNGIPKLESTGVTVDGTNLIINFNKYRNLFPYVGLMILKIPAYTASSDTLNVVANFGYSNIPVMDKGDVQITSAEYKSGIYLVFYEDSKLQIL